MPEYLKYYSRADIIKYLIRKYKKSQTPENLKLLEYFAKRAYLADDTYWEPDGKWDNRIANYLYSLKSDPSFNAGSYLADIEFILQGKAVPTPLNCAYSSLEDIQKWIEKSYQTVAEEIVNSWLWNFDTTSPYSLYKVTPQYKRDISEHYVPTTSWETEKFNFILTNSENWKLDKSLNSIQRNVFVKNIFILQESLHFAFSSPYKET